jgi:hypothetical protein
MHGHMKFMVKLDFVCELKLTESKQKEKKTYTLFALFFIISSLFANFIPYRNRVKLNLRSLHACASLPPLYV